MMRRVTGLNTLNIKPELRERIQTKASSFLVLYKSSLSPGALPLTFSSSVNQLKCMSQNNVIFGNIQDGPSMLGSEA